MSHQESFEPPVGAPSPPLRIVFGGMAGRFTTTPLQAMARHHRIVGLLESEPRPIRRGWLVDWARAGAGAGNLQRFADHYGCPLHHGRAGLGDFLRRCDPDLVCLSNYGVLLRQDVLGIPRLGVVNLHLSVLPRHRGPYPWLWMFHDGDRTGGATVHFVDAGEDTGPILGLLEYEVPEGITTTDLADRVLPDAAELLLRVVDAVGEGTATPVPQPPAEGLARARFVPPGEPLIDWETWPATRVWSFLRGASLWYEPFPPLAGFVREYGEVVPGPPGAPPGTVRHGLRGGWIACRDGRVTFRLRPVPRELARLAAPFVIGAGLWALG